MIKYYCDRCKAQIPHGDWETQSLSINSFFSNRAIATLELCADCNKEFFELLDEFKKVIKR